MKDKRLKLALKIPGNSQMKNMWPMSTSYGQRQLPREFIAFYITLVDKAGTGSTKNNDVSALSDQLN
jgi:hypothetical protein